MSVHVLLNLFREYYITAYVLFSLYGGSYMSVHV